ncbi:hypothetical protein BT96DRAFT_951330 [Gymnopus androsaceus JB14]|uniref:Uncharacterized protein n=1 Tax=Gymnopus androsaceus JB14 TaxID=1447944 RepID=A0A6A4GDB1_9AGAR|nr:hypothetical protein BT96DRAFT_951330 [Gymnopus androsaceus JB14]
MVHEVVPVVYTENRRLKGAIWLLKTALAVERTRVKKLQDDLNRKDIISLINGRVVQEVKKAPNHAPNHGYPYPSRTRGKIPAPYPSEIVGKFLELPKILKISHSDILAFYAVSMTFEVCNIMAECQSVESQQ